MSFEIWMFRSGQPDHDDDRIFFCSDDFVWVAFGKQLSYVKKITVHDTSSRVAYEVWNVNSIRWWCWSIATDEREVDYWKSKVITFFVEFRFYIFLRCPFQSDSQGKRRLLSVLYFKFIWIAAMWIINKLELFNEYNESWNEKSWLIFYLYSWKPLKEVYIISM